MQALSLLYHDVVPAGEVAASGFAGAGADRYKLDDDVFAAHLDAIAAAAPRAPVTIAAADPDGESLMLTFDDGGVSAYTVIAGLLEARGWRGHFLVTSGRVGDPTFLAPAQIRDLAARGHVIGSHTHSHPGRMAALDRASLVEEWRRSAEVLGDLLGEPVTVASVPGGFYAPRVASAAAETGFRTLFTSEPTTRVANVDGCLVVGRYSILRGMSARVAAALVGRAPGARVRQWVVWNGKKLVKRATGGAYLQLRRRLLGGS
jgi:peptidoglycan/xylan/chitin deacetylase (PgdA/CDA1 family)